MIFQRGRYWALSGDTRKFASEEEAQAAYNKILAKQELIKKREEEDRRIELQMRLEKISGLAYDSTPYEIMIEKNVCKLCNLEPCECFTSIKKMEPGP